MQRNRWRAGALAMVMVAAMAPTAALSSTEHVAHPDRVELPNGWQPEGITTDKQFLYVGSLADGAIWRARTSNGEGRVLAPGAEGRVAVGVDYDKGRDLIWVAGGDTGKIRAHDAETGRIRARYGFPSDAGRFVNDIVVTGRGVYATDSVNQELLVVPLDDGAELPPRSAATTIPLTGSLEYQEGFNLNGIDRSKGNLLAVQSNTGLVFRINRDTGRTRTVQIDGEPLTNGDGLEVDGDTMYVVRNQLNLIAVVELGPDRRSGTVVDEITDPEFDVPTTIAIAKDSLWAVNARFNTEPTPDTPYWVTRVDEYAG